MTHALTTAVTALALILAPLAASAHHKSGHGGGPDHAAHGNGNGNGNAFGHSRSSGDDVEDGDDAEDGTEAVDRGHPCAPGLAGREPACVPPGQAAQGVTTEDWIGEPTDQFAVGDDLDGEDFGWIVNADRLGLDELDEGERYALVDDTIVVVEEETLEILEIVRRAAIPGNSGG